MDNSKRYDIILYGATGYTGEITAEYLARHAKDIRWAIAGRSIQKLQELKQNLQNPNLRSVEDIDCIPCDATIPQQIHDLCASARVLINCVGPYRIYGEAVVAACVATRTDYLDATGEPPFVLDMIRKYHQKAQDTQVYVLPACAIGSAIPDIAVEALKESFQKEGSSAANIRGYLRYNGKYAKTFSNGTWQTFINSFSSKKRPATDAAPISVSTSTSSRKRQKRLGFHYCKEQGNWALPFVEGADLHVVRRTNELNMGNENFNYSQYTAIPLIPPLYFILTAFTVLALMLLSKIPFFRNMFLKRKFPDGGPNKEQRATTSVDFYALGVDDQNRKKSVSAHMPGPYDTSGICLAEVALVLATDRSKLKPLFGVVTPASIMQHQLIARLPYFNLTNETGGAESKTN